MAESSIQVEANIAPDLTSSSNTKMTAGIQLESNPSVLSNSGSIPSAKLMNTTAVLGYEELRTIDSEAYLSVASVLQSLHVLSVASPTGLVRVNQLVKRLMLKKVRWPHWEPANEISANISLVLRYVEALYRRNLAHVCGRDALSPGPIPEIGTSSVDIPATWKAKLTNKPIWQEPYACPGCYWRCIADLPQLSLDELLVMLAEALRDPQDGEMCPCPVDSKGRSSCGGQGNISTCPKITPSPAQIARQEGFRLFTKWLKLKSLNRRSEWVCCSSSKTESAAGHKSRPRHELYLCACCLAASRSHGLTRQDGLCAKELALLLHLTIMRDEKTTGGRHCFCKNCIDDPRSGVADCRRLTSIVSKKIDENIQLMREFIKKRGRRNMSSLFNEAAFDQNKVPKQERSEESKQTERSGSRKCKDKGSASEQKKLLINVNNERAG